MALKREKNFGERPHLYELIDKDGKPTPWLGVFKSVGDAAKIAHRIWPDQSQDPDRSGKGWSVQETCNG